MISTKQMDFDEKAQQFSAEASALGVPPGCSPYTKLPGDNMGIIVEHQGVARSFLLTRTETHEGDVRWWDFKLYEGTIRLRIFND